MFCPNEVNSKDILPYPGFLYVSSNPRDYQIKFGHRQFSSYNNYISAAEEIHFNPQNGSDIALIKLNRSLEFAPEIKSICLPEPNIINLKSEYAMGAGWGEVDKYREPLQWGARRLQPWGYKIPTPKEDFWKASVARINARNLMITDPIDNQTLYCKVIY